MNVTYKTNRYKISLLIIVDEITLNTTFYIIFTFLIDKIEKIFAWIIEHIKTLYASFDFFESKIIVIDRNFTLIIVLQKTYSNITNLLCVWYVNKNVVINCKFSFVDDEKNEKVWKKFYNFYSKIIYVHTKQQYQDAWIIFFLKYVNIVYNDLVKYIKKIYKENLINIKLLKRILTNIFISILLSFHEWKKIIEFSKL